MNLRTRQITIIHNKVCRDNRDGVNNATFHSSEEELKRPVCIFTQPGELNSVELRLEVGNETMLINLDQSQLRVLYNLLDPYLGEEFM
jgi:hypothetical protein